MLAFSGIIFLQIFKKDIAVLGDNATYYLLALSINQGDGYSNLLEAGKPATNSFPPGYPLLMAVIMFFNKGVFIQKIANLFFLSGAVIFLFFIARKFVTSLQAFFISVLCVTNFYLLRISTLMMSEASYVFFSMLTIWLVMTETKKSPFKSLSFYAIVFSVCFLWHIRTQGLALMIAILLFYLLKRQWSYAAFFSLLSTLCSLPWLLRNRALDLSGSRYLNQIMVKNQWRPEEGSIGLQELVYRFFETWKMLFVKAIPDSLFNFITYQQNHHYSLQLWVVALIILAITGAGFMMKMKNYAFLFLAYTMLSVSIIGLWSAASYNRYVVIIIPILLLGFYNGLVYLMELAIKRLNLHPRILLAVFIISCIAQIPKIKALKVENSKKLSANFSNYFQLGTFIREKHPQGNVVVSSRKPSLFYLYARSYGCKYPYTAKPHDMLQGLVDRNVDYVVVEQLGYISTEKYLIPTIKAYPQFFGGVKALKNPNTYLFRFRKRKAAAYLSKK